MNHFITWCSMGGYAGYVWSAYALVVVVLIAAIPVIKLQRRQIRKQMQGWFAREIR